MKLQMTMINSNDFQPLDENEYNENILRTDELGYFRTQIYFRNSKNQNYIPAFSIEDAADDYELAFSANKTGAEYKKFQRLPNSNFYCDISEKDSLGLSVVGQTYIFILKDGKIIESHKLQILPDKKECAAMIRELLFIRRELFQKSNGNKSSLSENLREKTWAEILEALNTQSEELFRLMKKIDARPRFGLQKFQEKCNVSKIRRFNEKIIRQYVIAPNRKKYTVNAEKKSFNIFENCLLKNKILQLKEFIERQSRQQKINAENLARDIDLKIQHIKSMQKKFSDSDKIFEENKLNLEAQLQLYKKNPEVSLNKILENLNKCLSLSIFDEVENRNENWRMTQIFTNDANYRRAYLKLKELDEIFDFSFDADEKSFPSEKMYQIYEWWVFAKIVEFLILKLQFKIENSPDNPADILRKIFDKLENIGNAHIHLTHKISKIEMEIFYNTSINESLNSTGCILRPDYLFKVTAGETTKFFILDAKYRNYEQQGYKFWQEKDLYGVCFEKYINQVKKFTGKEISMSFIVHSDNTKENFLGRYVIFNGTVKFKNLFQKLSGESQQIGSFYLLPNTDTESNQSEINLSLFFKMMFEYFMEKWQICWECGSNDVEKKEFFTGRYEKYHLRCKKCGAFWVKNHCCKCASSGTHTMLIKHVINYHVEQDGKWYVCCPKCGG